MARYSIDEKILTDMADGIRAAIGKSEGVPAISEAIYTVEGEGNSTDFSTEQNVFILTVLTPEAKKVLVKDISITSNECDELYFKVGYCNDGTYYSISPNTEYRVGSEYTPDKILLNATDMYFRIGASSRNIKTKIKISATVIALDADGNVLVNKEVFIPYSMTPEEMVKEINGLGDLPLVPDEVLHLTGDCKYKFAYGSQDWLVNSYGDRITTENISNLQNTFLESQVEYIPFELNCDPTKYTSLYSTFQNCSNLKQVPKINNCKIGSCENLFENCDHLRYIPNDINSWFDWTGFDTSTYKFGNNTFNYCYSLRSVPMDFLNHGDSNQFATYSNMYYHLFYNCCALDEIIGLPIPRADRMNFTSNMFNETFSNCYHLKDMTFATNEDGSPIVVKWKNQTIDLSRSVGYAPTVASITNYNSGITADKLVNDNTNNYDTLKNDPDWFSNVVSYSRYNHDSAVRTINSLPDTSAFGTNIIKFKGAAGSATDGGAINTLTEEEIAVATARGWTVSLV